MYDFKKIEEDVLRFWKQKKIYEKSVKKNSKGKPFYMMDGPPYANGNIHMGHALNKISKDIVMRNKRLQGFDVFDRAGYDTHGVPIEYQIEKEIGSKSKQDIEKFGVKKFINKCKKFATKYIGVMNKDFENLGVWMDFKNPYLTLEDNYIEGIWETFKKADEKGLLYLGKYPVHACPRCATAVAYNEIEYGKQEDTSVYVKFPIKNEKNKFLIIWTTTPWTLPGNTGIMVNPEIEYSEIEQSNQETWIIAKEKVSELMSAMERGYTIKKTIKGKELEGLEYKNPLEKNLKRKIKKGNIVILAPRFVNLEEGTGLVHCAPGHGKEDYEAGKKYNLDMPSPVQINGLMSDEAGKYAGKRAREVDAEIIEDLEKDGFLIHKHKHVHDYPLCWRCKTPLLMISMPQWFFKISNIHKKILKSNQEVNWIPKYMKLRMKAWLDGISDWPISRNRYWGTPLPIWVCNSCDKKIVIGSIKELEKISKKKVKGVHKPEIDEVKWGCRCGGEFKRVPEVLDVWFDSGVSSWAALNYPREDKKFKKFWPADLNIEGKDQVRGWWNSQIILSEIRFGKKPFKNILVHGMVLDLGKIKMSKSVGNIISPQDIVDRFGRDYMRYYLAKTSKGEDFGFDEKEFKDVEKIFRVLMNVNRFANQLENKKSKTGIEDKWITSKLNSTINKITEDSDNLKYPEAIQKLERFLVEDLSRTYIRIIRDRADEAKSILEKIIVDILKLLAPITPFITEHLWQDLKKKKVVKEESIHLSSWPKADKKKINVGLEKRMENILRIIEMGLAERDKAKIGLRWPLAKASISCDKGLDKDLQEIIKSQLNIKKVELKKAEQITVNLDTKLTPELESEGYAREMSRQVQAFRKKLGLEKKDRVELIISTDEKFKKTLESQKNFIKERTNSRRLEIVTTGKERFKNKVDFKIKDKRGNIEIIC
ncbi:isoleucine--tRNA ligase [archaeon BMS3Abin17]|nr:isoleucine--tRNA ligase [archaeon BMS3Abin17]